MVLPPSSLTGKTKLKGGDPVEGKLALRELNYWTK